MKFDYNMVYSAVNADKLHIGDKVICANDMGHLKHYVTSNGAVLELKSILDENNSSRFVAGTGKVLFNLAYLIESAENCTNCDGCVSCIKPDKAFVCEDWKPKTDNKCAGPKAKCSSWDNCKHGTEFGCPHFNWINTISSCSKYEAKESKEKA